MVLKQYGITYKKLKKEHLEMLRGWRNAPEIVQYMQKREYITPEMQLQWFNTINNKNNYYFIIHTEATDVGLVHCKNINYEEKTAEIGIFISDILFQKSKIFLYASMTVLNFSFKYLDLKSVNVNVVDTNEAFLKIVQKLNFEFVDNKGISIKSQMFCLSRENYLSLFKKYSVISKLLAFEEMNLDIIEDEG